MVVVVFKTRKKERRGRVEQRCDCKSERSEDTSEQDSIAAPSLWLSLSLPLSLEQHRMNWLCCVWRENGWYKPMERVERKAENGWEWFRAKKGNPGKRQKGDFESWFLSPLLSAISLTLWLTLYISSGLQRKCTIFTLSYCIREGRVRDFAWKSEGKGIIVTTESECKSIFIRSREEEFWVFGIWITCLEVQGLLISQVHFTLSFISFMFNPFIPSLK